MKLTVDHEKGKILLTVPTTEEGEATKDIYLPIKNLHYWYPFNINFSYKYSNAKEYIYLVKHPHYTGENVYNTGTLKESSPMELWQGVPVHPKVHTRNLYIIERAKILGIPVITEEYRLRDVEAGFKDLGDMITVVKQRIEERYLSSEKEDFTIISTEEEGDQEIYKVATKKELLVLNELGEIHAMLNVMRKIVEGS